MTAESAACSFAKLALRIILLLFFTAAALHHGQASSSEPGGSAKKENPEKNQYSIIRSVQKLKLGSTLSKGNYVLELLVLDKNRKVKDGLLSQVMDFQIID